MNLYPAKLLIAEGELVMVGGRPGTIVEVLGLETVLVSDYESGKTKIVPIAEVKPYKRVAKVALDLDSLERGRLEIARRRLECIHPLLKKGRTRDDVEMRAEELGLHPSTLYEWLKVYESSKLLSSLASSRRSDKGTKRLAAEVEQIVEEVIESEYLTRQKKTGAYVCREVRRRCAESGLTPPHSNTIRKRLKSISGYKAMLKREGAKAAREKYCEIKGEFPGADWPLACVQIDHTRLDIVLVDDIHRLPIDRPWITLAIDVFSRMVTGFHISFDPPSSVSVGLCLSQSILPKEKWLAERGVEGVWPCFGVPATIHVDNAKEFRGDALQLVCEQYGIGLEWRPVGRPNFGATVERIFRTLGGQVQSLPGTTFSNVQVRGQYDSEGEAVFTLSEFETWLTVQIVQVYHLENHSALNMAPIEKYKQGVLGDGNCVGSGVPDVIVDEEKLLLDFLPYVERTIQQYGVAVDKVYYMHDVLRRWINAPDPNNQKLKRKFKFRRDPRDISVLWFFDPEVETYYPIPYRDTSRPPINVWELRKAKKRLVDAGRKGIDEDQVFEALSRMREMEESAGKETKKARRARQRRAMGIGATKRRVKVEAFPPEMEVEWEELEDLKPFNDLDDR